MVCRWSRPRSLLPIPDREWTVTVMDSLKPLAVAPELAQLCTQNGWIDNDSLRVDVMEQTPTPLTAVVTVIETIR